MAPSNRTHAQGEQLLAAAAIQAIAAGVLPLYEEFLLDHERRLQEYERPDLAQAFVEWQQRLQA